MERCTRKTERIARRMRQRSVCVAAHRAAQQKRHLPEADALAFMVRVTGLEARACGAGFARCAIVWQVQVLRAGGVPRSKKGTCPKQMPSHLWCG